MSPLDHWHPVLLSRELGTKPRGIKLLGREIVVFRTRDRIAALEDRCPHRGMRLSCGAVDSDQLVCPYHGWRFEPGGQGHSPCTPRLRARALAYDAIERDGAIWLARRGSTASIPQIAYADFHLYGTFRVRARVPLQIVHDNFSEIEHTALAHKWVGFELDDMQKVSFDVELGDEEIKLRAEGPQRPLPPVLWRFVGINPKDRVVIEIRERFAPVYNVVDQHWLSPRGRVRPLRARLQLFLNPVDASTTDIVMWSMASEPNRGRLGFNRLLSWSWAQLSNYEAKRDAWISEKVADTDPDLREYKLSRFDKALVRTRENIQRYLGEEPFDDARR